jgi:hypothetical protein
LQAGRAIVAVLDGLQNRRNVDRLGHRLSREESRQVKQKQETTECAGSNHLAVC